MATQWRAVPESSTGRVGVIAMYAPTLGELAAMAMDHAIKNRAGGVRIDRPDGTHHSDVRWEEGRIIWETRRERT